MEINYETLRKLVKKSLEECGGMVHPTAPTPITIIPNKKPDHEGKMAKRQVFGIANDAAQIEAMNEVPLETFLELEKQVIAFRDALGGGNMTKSRSNNFLQFLQSRIEHMTLRDAGLKEAAKSKNQQQLMGAALRCKRTGDCSNEQVKKLANSMSEKELEDFASTSHKGLPNKVQENTMADNAKEQSKDKKGDVRDVAKFMFKDQRLGPALAKLKDDKREAAQLISIIGGQLGLTPEDLVQIAKMASREG
jgi:poly-D-alanine transfer protein DltD